VGALLIAGIVSTLREPIRIPRPPEARATNRVPRPGDTAATAAQVELAGEIVRKNLFAPHRLDGPGAPSSTPPGVPLAGPPILHGVVVGGDLRRAFLEEPGTKRVAGFSVGDAIAGGMIRSITDDRVVIETSSGLAEVLLRDPSKPQPAPVLAANVPVTTTAVAAPQPPSAPASAPPPPVLGRRIRE
jgi:type II secretory pathway component PulC